MQAQQPFWKFLQKHSVVNFVVKTSVAAVVGLITVGGVSVNLSGEGSLAHSATNCVADDHTYAVAYGESWSNLAARFHVGQNLLSSHNKQMYGKELQANEKICLPAREKHIIVDKTRKGANVAIATGTVKKLSTFHFRARAVVAPRSAMQPPAAADVVQTVPIGNRPVQTTQAPMVGQRNPFPYPACTWWADQRYYQLHGTFVPWSNGANAWQWSARAADYGWRISGTPTAGSIIVLQPYVEGAGEYGHVAYVEQVIDNSRVIASSMNWGASPYTVTRGVFSSGGGVTFIHP